jgi:hypothetical protein
MSRRLGRSRNTLKRAFDSLKYFGIIREEGEHLYVTFDQGGSEIEPLDEGGSEIEPAQNRAGSEIEPPPGSEIEPAQNRAGSEIEPPPGSEIEPPPGSEIEPPPGSEIEPLVDHKLSHPRLNNGSTNKIKENKPKEVNHREEAVAPAQSAEISHRARETDTPDQGRPVHTRTDTPRTVLTATSFSDSSPKQEETLTTEQRSTYTEVGPTPPGKPPAPEERVYTVVTPDPLPATAQEAAEALWEQLGIKGRPNFHGKPAHELRDESEDKRVFTELGPTGTPDPPQRPEPVLTELGPYGAAPEDAGEVEIDPLFRQALEELAGPERDAS